MKIYRLSHIPPTDFLACGTGIGTEFLDCDPGLQPPCSESQVDDLDLNTGESPPA